MDNKELLDKLKAELEELNVNKTAHIRIERIIKHYEKLIKE